MQHPRLLVLAAVLAAGAASQPSGADLPPDPEVVRGSFENGLRYAVRRHSAPPGELVVMLVVETGSLDDPAGRPGLAHFVEHMAFNGSRHFPPGEIARRLGKRGMRFGADTNGVTTYRRTVYSLHLPDVSEETLEPAFTALEDFASGLSFDEEEIRSERPVVLEELRLGGRAQARLQQDWLARVFEGSRFASRPIAGTESSIASITRRGCLEFWNRRYRPERMILIAAGDLEPEALIERTRRHLGTFRARAPEQPSGSPGVVLPDRDRAFVLPEAGHVGCRVEVVTVRPAPSRAEARTRQGFRLATLENVAAHALAGRLTATVASSSRGAGGAHSAACSVGPLEGWVTLATAGAAGPPQKSAEMLEDLVLEIARAVRHGFTRGEVERARLDFLAGSADPAAAASRLDSRQHARRMLEAASGLRPPLSPLREIEEGRDILEHLDAGELNEALGRLFGTGPYTYLITLPAERAGDAPAPEAMLETARSVWGRKIEAVAEADSPPPAPMVFEMPPPGIVVAQSTDPDLGITTLELGNGVVVHHRTVATVEGRASIRITIPGGAIAEPPRRRGISMALPLLFEHPATRDFGPERLSTWIAGRSVTLKASLGHDELVIDIEGARTDLEAALQLVHILLREGEIREADFARWREATLERAEAGASVSGGAGTRAEPEMVYRGDPRFVPLTPAEVRALDLAAVRDWSRFLLRYGPMEVAMVGDLSLRDVLSLSSRYLGSLPQRMLRFDVWDPYRRIEAGGGKPGQGWRRTVEIETSRNIAIVHAGFAACDESELRDCRLLRLAALILRDRLNDTVREKDELVYRIDCNFSPGVDIAGAGLFEGVALCAPANAPAIADRIHAILRDFAQGGPTPAELLSARRKMAAWFASLLPTPGFWLNQIAELRFRRRSLETLKQAPAIYDTFTGEEIRAAAARWFHDEGELRLLLLPRRKKASPHEQQ